MEQGKKAIHAFCIILAATCLFCFSAFPEMGSASTTGSDRVLIIKSKRIMFLMRDGEILKTYRIALGRQPVGHKIRAFQEDIVPLLNTEFVDSVTHKSGVSALLAASRRKLSLVYCVSFEVIRTLGIKNVFAFDTHFSEQGVYCIS